MLLGACDSPTTPKNNPDSGQQGKQGQNGGSSGGGSISGGGSYSHTKDPLTPEGKPLHDDPGIKPDEKVTVTVTVKSVGAAVKGFEAVASYSDEQQVKVEVEGAADVQKVKDAVAEVVAKNAGAAADKKLYRFFTDDAATTVVSDVAGFTGGAIVHVGKLKATLQVTVKDGTATGGVGSTYKAAIGNSYTNGKPIDVNLTDVEDITADAGYVKAVMKKLAEGVAADSNVAVPLADAEVALKFSKNKDNADAAVDYAGLSSDVFVFQKKKVQAKITLKLLTEDTGAITADPHDFKGKKVIIPSDNDSKGKAMFDAVGAGGKFKTSDDVYEITEEVFKKVADEIMAIIKGAGTLGTAATNYVLFKQGNPGVDATGYIKDKDIKYADFKNGSLTNVTVFIGYIES